MIAETETGLTVLFPQTKLDYRQSPNGRSRLHWGGQKKITARQKADAATLIKQALDGRDAEDFLTRGGLTERSAALPVTVIFTRYYCGPSKIYDDDNLRLMWKAYRDGVAAALGIDDNPKQMTGEYRQEIIKNTHALKIEVILASYP